jgi:microcystin-dependent protein
MYAAEDSDGSGVTDYYPTGGTTGVSQTGISIQATGDFGMGASAPALNINAAVTGITIGATGGGETVPQNVALDYYIKAVNDSTNSGIVTGIDSSDPQMISINSANPVVPIITIHSNVAFGTVKLDASGKVPLNQIPQGAQQLLGFFDASAGNNPSQAFPTTNFSAGDTYIVSVGGSIECFDPVTLVSALRPVAVGSLLQWIEDSLTNPTGWYTVAQSSTIAASSVVFAPAGAITATNVQDAIVQVQGNIPTTAAQIAYVPGGTIVQTNVQLAIDELDADTQVALGQKAAIATTVAKDSSTGAAKMPVGTTLQRPSVPQFGDTRGNTDSSSMEWFNGVSWSALNVASAAQVSFVPFGGISATNVQAAIQELDSEKAPLSAVTPAGAIMDFAMNAAPTGWLACDGALVSRATYAALFAAIGTTWGAGDGSTTFQLPDMRGYFRRGVGTNSDGTAAGAFAAKQVDELKSHFHNMGTLRNDATTGSGVPILGLDIGGVTTAIDGGGAETRPKNIAVLTCIKT